MSKRITLTAFAAEVGVTKQAISKAIRAGRLMDCVIRDPLGNVLGLDPEKAREEWAQNSSEQVSPEVAKANPPEKPITAGGVPSYAAARAVRENYQARIAKLIFEEKIGKLVDSDTVKIEAFKTARSVRDALLNIPDRVSLEFANETDAFKIRERLNEEIRRAIEALKNDF